MKTELGVTPNGNLTIWVWGKKEAMTYMFPEKLIDWHTVEAKRLELEKLLTQ